ncbi:MAG: LpqB family beta-propeller domain-containing protein [Acidobacteriota bacterium]|nr:LpqB family beta-propeller domain-containing protein [Acidobacteriota bacterium]
MLRAMRANLGGRVRPVCLLLCYLLIQPFQLSTPKALAATPAGAVPGAKAAAARVNATSPPSLQGSQTPFHGTPFAVPGTIQLEDFDNGGEGVAYHDATPGNQGEETTYRANIDVDLMGGPVVGGTEAGEWLEYTINVSASGNTYAFVTQVGSYLGGGTFHIEVDGVDKTGPLTVPDTGGWWEWQTVTKTGVSLTAGQHVLRLALDTNGGSYSIGHFDTLRVVETSAPQTPFKEFPLAVPGIIQAEDFDHGVEGVAYHDVSAGNNGGDAYRDPTDVDICGGPVVCDTKAGEWLEYTINVAATKNYNFVVQIGSYLGGGTFHIEIDGVNKTGPLTMPDTGSWWVWQTVTSPSAQLTAGQHVMRLVMDTNGGSYSIGHFDTIRVVDSAAPQSPFTGMPFAVPGVIQAENFDNGGEGISWHDTSAGNSGNEYRDTDVDVQGAAVVDTAASEWVEYTVHVASTSTYTIDVQVGSYLGGGTFHIEVDGVDKTGPLTMPDTGSWWVWQTVTKTGVSLTQGEHVMRLKIDTNGGSYSVGHFDLITVRDEQTPPNGKIAFSSNRDGNHEIYSMNADGTNQVRLTNNAAGDIEPDWSPDGTRIAFTSNRDGNREIYVINADGSNQVRLTNNSSHDSSPAWSPDGQQIAFISERDGNYEIYVMYADGFGQVRLTDHWAADTDPSWSPDGSRIAFTSARDGNDEIYLMNPDGEHLTRLTNNPTVDAAPTWSPGGAKIAFTSNRGGNKEIFVMNRDGSGPTALTSHAAIDTDADWSPDGTKITFMSLRAGNHQIFVMNSDGTNPVRLTNNTANDNWPSWQAGAAGATPTPTPTPTPSPTATPTPLPTPAPGGTVVADVVAFDQVFFYNRLGALNPAGMIYALRRDVVPIDSSRGLVPGNVRLRDGKRARPLTLRMNVGQKLEIRFQNLLDPNRADDNQPATRTASVHVTGLQLVNSIRDDGSNVGQNPPSLVAPGGSITYTYYAEREGNHLFYSTAATTGGEGDGGSLAMGLFGMVNVEPQGAEWYRSQVTRAEMEMATVGRTPAGQPVINYDALYPPGHPRAGLPVLKILHGSEIVHGDLTAVITGPNKGCFTTTGQCPPRGTDPPDGAYRSNPAEPDRNQPFREFSIVYHDEIKAVQAFPQFFEDPILAHTLHSVRDAFAINYGTGGIGAEILANRLGVGPMADCTDCLYEEFFLSSWTVGDPAQIVDHPASAQVDSGGNKIPGAPRATKVFFPEDPSNVYHGYLNDHTKFRVVHAGPKEHHIHHLHAHQWFHTPDSDNSTVLDSQAFGPGYSFTTEILHGGAGNRSKTPGDSIFHCHFYPHFAMGMWSHWRVHDVFEEGTPLDGDGRPAAGARALPDGEIMAGTPIPGVVPLPAIPMPPMPQAQVSVVNGQAQVSGAGHPGYPFFVPGVAGHRPPHPPLDTVDDGGLPRHIITGGVAVHHKEHLPQFDKNKARLDFDKSIVEADARAIPEDGTLIEKAAMNFHAQRTHPSFTPLGQPGNFITNGRPPKPGAPFSDPCVDDFGNAAGLPRLYKSANIQLDVKFNKAGWHFPQQRISALWADVASFLGGAKPPEPLFFRANTNDCVTFRFTNLVPRVYVQDDFQVRTPTDIMGQHIHLVKFDVLASDGAANGWNYEDGSFAPEEVIERIHAINARGGLQPFNGGARFTLTPEAHPFFGTLGAQTTVSRWFADDVRNRAGEDRTLRTAFTHDHFGPSTHQQVGLYAGLVIEPLASTWRHSETGQVFGGRFDGGPTSWRADILTANPADSYREFLVEFADFQHAYKAGGGVDANGHPVPDPPNAINPPGKKEVGLPFLLEPPDRCPVEEGHEASAPFPPCPEAISADDVGTMVINYRNEPLPHRVAVDPNAPNPQQAAGLAGDLSHVYRSDITRAFAPMNSQPNFYPPLTGGLFNKDPFTPLLRAYEDDKVQIRVLVGAHEEGHNFGVHGIKWLFEPAEPNSGYRNNQMMGISEHFEFIIPTLPKSSIGSFADYLYQPGVAVDDQWNGLWGIMRAYNRQQNDLQPLPNNPDGHGPIITNVGDFNGVCPKTAPVRNFSVAAVTAQNALPGGTLVYNPRTNLGGKLHDPTAILYVRSTDLNASGQLLPGTPVEPLVLRASAGDCINLTLFNKLPATAPDLDGFNTLPMIVNRFNANQLRPSSHVGLHPQLVFFDVTRADGTNVGFNKVQTAAPGQSITYQWYAGDMNVQPNGVGSSIPIEFGASNLQSSDPVKHSNKGAIGSLIIEPQGATWVEDAGSRAQATVTSTGGSFREFVLLHQTDVNLRFGERFDASNNPRAVPNLAEAEDPEDSGQKAFNYRTEPLWKRMGFEPDTPLEQTRDFIFTNVLTNGQVGGDPVTPVFTAAVGTPTRFRLLMPGGHARNSVFNLHGHIWEELPYIANSTRLGHNPFSEWKGSQFGIGAGSHFDVLLKHGAGGRFLIRGDYLYRNQTSFLFDGGMWGIFRVQ